MDDDAIRALVTSLSRPHRSGGDVIERAAILAAGSDSSAVVAWIVAHHGEPEAAAEPASSGLYGSRLGEGSSLGTAPAAAVCVAARHARLTSHREQGPAFFGG